MYFIELNYICTPKINLIQCMPQFAISIAEDIRKDLTRVPPPIWNKRTGEFVPYASAGDIRYLDLNIMKSVNVVYVDEELDVYAHPGSHSHYRMMIRRMPWKADLQLILAAAQHMLLIGPYELTYEHREGLSPDMESGFWDLKYSLATEQFKMDADTLCWQEVAVPYHQRKRIWMELFAAMGHRVKWGSSVLNVRKRQS